MGLTSSMIKRHVNRLRPGEMFTTRDVLGYGKRKTVDNVLYRMVKKGEIERLARGVFMKPSSRQEHRPSSMDVLKTKMRSWGKVFYHDRSSNQLPTVDKTSAASTLTIFVLGSSSSFLTSGGTKVVLQHTGSRKMKLSSTPAGQLGRRVWNAGKEQLANFHLHHEHSRLGQEVITDFLKTFRLLPAWLNDVLYEQRWRYFGMKLWDISLAPHEFVNAS